ERVLIVDRPFRFSLTFTFPGGRIRPVSLPLLIFRKVQHMTRVIRRVPLHVGCCLLLCFAAFAAAGSDNEITLSKQQPLVLKIPRKLLKFENYSIRSGLPIYIADISVVGETITVEGEPDWQSRGWPPLLTLFYEKSSKKKEYIEIE